MRKLLLTAAALLVGAGSAGAEGIPGARGIDHIGLTVPSIDEAVAFLDGVIGCSKPAYFAGPFKSNDDWMQVHLNVDPRAEIARLAVVRCGFGTNLELFEYNAPSQTRTEARNSDIGGHHVAFYVDDMTKAVAYMKSKGVKLLGEPTTLADGGNGGETFLYFLAPWGAQMELVSYPNGMNYEKTAAEKLWTPKDPAH